VNNDRVRISPIWLTGAIGIGIALALAAAYPRGSVQARHLASLPPSELSVAYLEAWLRVSPNSPEYLGLLGTQYLGLGKWDAAERVAQRLEVMGDDETHRRGVLLELAAAEQQAYEVKIDDPRRPELMVRYIGLLAKTTHDKWDVPIMRALAQKSEAAGATAVMLFYYRQLAAADTENASAWQEKLGAAAFAQQSYVDAANAYFAAQDAAQTVDDKRRYFITALKVLESGNQVALACDEGAKHAGSLAQDQQTLRYLLDLARQAGRTDLMVSYARALAKLSSIDNVAGPQLAAFEPSESHGLQLLQQGQQSPVYLDGYAGLQRLRQLGGARFYRVAATTGTTAAVTTAAVTTGTTAGTTAAATTATTAGTTAATKAGTTAGTSAAPAGTTTASTSKAAVTANDYDLAYKAFVESNRLDDAEQLAQQALARHLDPLVWTRRLAQVAQWNNHPVVALKYWKEYAEASGNDEAWNNVLKLAPQLNDDQAYLAALMHAAQQSPGNLSLQDQVVDTYERLGQPQESLSYLKSHATGALRRPLLERYAQVAERRGDDDEALRTYRTLQAEFGPSSQYAMLIATIEFQKGQMKPALMALRQVRDKVGTRKEDAPYWQTYAELSRLSEQQDDTNYAYKHLLATGESNAADLTEMTNFYEGYPIDAGRVAELQFRKDGSETALQSAMYFYTVARAWPRIESLLAGLTPEQRTMFDHSSTLLADRAEYYRQIERWDASLADLRIAAQLPGATDETRVTYLWALVDFGNDDELNAAVRRWQDTAKNNAAYWGAFGAAELRLDNPVVALKYLHDQAALSDDDPLWMLSLADALEQAGHPEEAWRVRRAVWRDLETAAAGNKPGSTPRSARRSTSAQRLTVATGTTPDAAAEARAARVTLSETFANGDRSRDMLIAMLEADRRDANSPAVAQSLLGGTIRGLADDTNVVPVIPVGAAAGNAAANSTPGLAGKPGQKTAPALAGTPTAAAPAPAQKRLISATAKDVTLAWAVSAERNDLARAWLGREYANRLLRPADSEVTLALAENDAPTLARILDSRAGRVPIDSRVDALDLIGRTPAAESAAFKAGQNAPESDDAHLAMTETLMRDRVSVGGDVIAVRESPIEYIENSVTGGVVLTNGLDLIVDALQRNQRSVDKTTLAWIPAHDRIFDVTLRNVNIDRDLSVTVGHRDELSSFYTANVHGEFNRNGAFTTNFTLGVNQFTDISPEMQVAATKDMLLLGAQWNTDTRIFAQASLEGDRYHAQDRSYLGQGLIMTGEVGYRIRTDYPDWNIRLVAERGTFSAGNNAVASLSRLLPVGNVAQASDFLPENVDQYGFMTGFGTDYETNYTRAWRPYLDVGLMHDSNQGWGPQVSLGVAGSIMGNDHVRIYYSHEAVAGSGASVTQIGVSYRLYY
jgi:hypothetical protein